MSRINTALQLLWGNKRRFLVGLLTYFGFWFPDEIYLKIMYYLETGNKLNLKNPTGFCEKLQWLKLYDRNPNYSQMVDKIEVKRYVEKIIGKDVIIPTIGVWNSLKHIDIDSLPNQFVLKTSHGGGGVGVVVCKDKSKMDYNKTIKQLQYSLKQDIFKQLREWPYKNMKKRVFAEQYIEQEGGLVDYKVLCFSGKAKLIEYHSNRFSNHHTQDFYDVSWNKTQISQGGSDTVSDIIAPRPECLDKMIEYSEIIARNMSHCRVDWYIVDNHLYFGEITFFDASGFEMLDRDEDELLLGSWIDLTMSYCYKKNEINKI